MRRKPLKSMATIGVAVALVSLLIACGSNEDDSKDGYDPATNMVNEAPASSELLMPTVENSGRDCALTALPEYDQLATPIAALPDPFTRLNGERITRKSDWRCRRAEIGAQAQHYELGSKPATPEKTTGTLSGETLTVKVEHKGKTLTFDAEITLPRNATPPYPAMIGMGAVSLDKAALLDLGIALINFPNNDLAEQLNAQSRGKGKFYEFYGSDHSAGAMMAWSWGVSRLIDALENTETPINAARLGVTGCSRNGKGALIAGAFDERIALTIPQESGAGGAASWRVSDAQRAAGQNVQTLRQIVTENVWFTEDFKAFSESATLLPFDHHSVMGMVAPRGLLVVDNSIEWLGIESTYTTTVVAQEIWKALGVADHMGITQVLAHSHCQQPASVQPAITAFARKFLLDEDSVDTNVMKTENAMTVDKNRWVNWTTPTLR